MLDQKDKIIGSKDEEIQFLRSELSKRDDMGIRNLAHSMLETLSTFAAAARGLPSGSKQLTEVEPSSIIYSPKKGDAQT